MTVSRYNFRIFFEGKMLGPFNLSRPGETWRYFNRLAEGGKSLQSSGLVDRNGEEIFEGDLWKGVGEAAPICKVYYNSKAGAFKFEPPNKESMGMFVMSEVGEVIGNIYQNPELVEELSEV